MSSWARHLAIAAAGCAFTAASFAGGNQAPTATMTAPFDGTKYMVPSDVDLVATASDSDGSIAKIEFYQNGVLIPGSATTTSPYTFHWANVPAGAYSVKARAYDNLGKTGDSPAIQVQLIQPTTVISSPASGAVIAGRSVDVSGTYSSTVFTTVIVTAGGGHSVVANALSGAFTAHGVELSPGQNTIEVGVARADGTSEWIQTSVTAVDPPLVVMLSPNSCTAYTAPANVMLSADAASAQGTVSAVEFFDGGTSLGTVTSPPYSLSYIFSTAGDHSITARATSSFGLMGNSSPIIVTVSPPPNSPPTVTLISPADGATYTAPAQVSLAAAASDADGTVDHVDFLANGVVVGTTAVSPYQFTWSNVAPATYDLAARATDNSGASTTSATNRVVVSANHAPTTSITSPIDGAKLDSPASTNITVAASDSDGSVAAVQVFVNGTLLGNATLVSGTYSIPWSNVEPGSYALTAVATDNVGAQTTSAPVNLIVEVHTDRGETIVFLHNDFAGNTIAATDVTGALLWKENYKPFGDRIVHDPTATLNRQWFAGKPEDSDVGLLYFGARYYDPVAGRFASIDEKQFEDIEVQSFNRYVYSYNNPYKFSDPDGLEGVNTLWMSDTSPIVVTGKALGALAAFGLGISTGNQALANEAVQGMREGQSANIDAVIFLGTLGKGGNVGANNAAGAAFERRVMQELQASQSGLVQQVTVKTASGVKTRLDILGRDAEGAIKCTECKSSATAPLTKNQAAAFPEIESTGATVVGKGKPGFSGGTQLPPTKVEIVRPSGTD